MKRVIKNKQIQAQTNLYRPQISSSLLKYNKSGYEFACKFYQCHKQLMDKLKDM